jgi:tetratricopeptide (TPR) repeat protein
MRPGSSERKPGRESKGLVMSKSQTAVESRARWLRLAALGVLAALAIVLVLVAREYTWLVPRSLRRRVSGWFLRSLLLLYPPLAVLALAGTALLPWFLVRHRERPQRALFARLLALCVACLVGLAATEAGAWAWRARAHRYPRLPLEFPREPASSGATPGENEDDREPAEIVVIGESSALGVPYNEPYHPMPGPSVGMIVGWQLERAIPGRRFHVDVRAVAGSTLEQEHRRLAGLKRRPDVLVVYAGHNEFHSRFAWERTVPPEPTGALGKALRRITAPDTPLTRLIREEIARNGVDTGPSQKITRRLVDRALCTHAERAELLADFRNRLEAITTYCERIGALPVLIIPPGNDAGYEPNRSVALDPLTEAEIEALTREFEAARALEATDPARAVARYREFLHRQPGFSEAHYRLARLLEQTGDYDAAYREYILARDDDGFPQRCPTDFQDAYRTVAARHASSLLIDGQAVFRALSPHRILDDHLFHDGQHPALIGHVALAQAVLEGLHVRRVFGWTADVPTPAIEPAECAAHFGIDAERWAYVCMGSARFYERMAYVRYDPSLRLSWMVRYVEAMRAILAGRAVEDIGIPGLGTRPTWTVSHGPGRAAR